MNPWARLRLGAADSNDGGAAPKGPVKFGAVAGVFTPTLLTILGVIMYVRLPWVVGNAGLLGAWLIMALAIGITACTGLSLSSIATNTRIGAGGPYAIIHRSLGVEVGGSIGIPLYLTRPLGTAMYIFGFREGWQWVFPEHPAIAIDLAVFAVIFLLAYRGADLAFRVQYLIMGVVALSIASIVLSPTLSEGAQPITWWGGFEGFPEDGFAGVSPWLVFAIFFPATTGILAGANMSGELKDPRRAIPRGTIWALVVSSLIYFLIAWVASRVATPDQLRSDYNVLIDAALVPGLVLAGLLGATFSSALAGCVGGPRILMAMAQHRILPQSPWLSRLATDGEPRNAVLVTMGLTFAALMLRDLNAIAPLLTMFFLITYSVINVVLLLETSLGLVSFRPTLRMPAFVPLLGTVGGIFAMFIITPTFGLVSVSLVLAIYAWVLRLKLSKEGESVRSNIFVSIAEWAAAKVTELERTNVRAWKPQLLIPFRDPAEIRGEFPLIVDICKPEGSVKLLGLTTDPTEADMLARVDRLASAFRRKGVFATKTVVEAESYPQGVSTGLQALQGAFFKPNILLLNTSEDAATRHELRVLLAQARKTGVGGMVLSRHRKAGLGVNSAIQVWVRDPPVRDLESAFASNNLNLCLLMGFRLAQAWDADLTLISVVGDESQSAPAEAFLRELAEVARLPRRTAFLTPVGRFPEVISKAPPSDLGIFGISADPDFDLLERVTVLSRSSCLFVADSGRESARA